MLSFHCFCFGTCLQQRKDKAWCVLMVCAHDVLIWVRTYLRWPSLGTRTRPPCCSRTLTEQGAKGLRLVSLGKWREKGDEGDGARSLVSRLFWKDPRRATRPGPLILAACRAPGGSSPALEICRSQNCSPGQRSGGQWPLWGSWPGKAESFQCQVGCFLFSCKKACSCIHRDKPPSRRD